MRTITFVKRLFRIVLCLSLIAGTLPPRPLAFGEARGSPSTGTGAGAPVTGETRGPVVSEEIRISQDAFIGQAITPYLLSGSLVPRLIASRVKLTFRRFMDDWVSPEFRKYAFPGITPEGIYIPIASYMVGHGDGAGIPEIIPRVWHLLVQGMISDALRLVESTRDQNELMYSLLIDKNSTEKYHPTKRERRVNRVVDEILGECGISETNVVNFNDVVELLDIAIENIFQHVFAINGVGLITALKSTVHGSDTFIYIMDSGLGMPIQKVFFSDFKAPTTTKGVGLQFIVNKKELINAAWFSKGEKFDLVSKQISIAKTPLRGTLVEIRIPVSPEPSFAMTGATGFIGNTLQRVLKEKGYRVIALVRSPEKMGEAIPDEVVSGDLLDNAAVRRLAASAPTIFHLGALSEIKAANENPRSALLTNVLGTALLVEQAHRLHHRVIFASSISIYQASGIREGQAQEQTELPAFEEPAVAPWVRETTMQFARLAKHMADNHGGEDIDSVMARSLASMPDSLKGQTYAVSKYLAERIVLTHPENVAFRLGWVYGPGDTGDKIVANLMRMVLGLCPPFTLRNDRRQVLYAPDLAQILIQLAQNPDVPRLVNIAAPDPATMESLIAAIQNVEPRASRLTIESTVSGISPSQGLVVATDRLLAAVNPFTFTSLEEGIADTVTWWRSRLSDIPGAVGLWRRIGVRNVVVMGYLEAFVATVFSAWRLDHSSAELGIKASHMLKDVGTLIVATWPLVVVGLLIIFVLHYYTGVAHPDEDQEPITRDFRLSLRATTVAASSFLVGIPLLASGMAFGFLWAKVAGIVYSFLIHPLLNQRAVWRWKNQTPVVHKQFGELGWGDYPPSNASLLLRAVDRARHILDHHSMYPGRRSFEGQTPESAAIWPVDKAGTPILHLCLDLLLPEQPYDDVFPAYERAPKRSLHELRMEYERDARGWVLRLHPAPELLALVENIPFIDPDPSRGDLGYGPNWFRHSTNAPTSWHFVHDPLGGDSRKEVALGIVGYSRIVRNVETGMVYQNPQNDSPQTSQINWATYLERAQGRISLQARWLLERLRQMGRSDLLGSRLLDIGTGYGLLLNYLHDYGAWDAKNLYGMDIEIPRGKDRMGLPVTGNLVEGSAPLHIPFPDHSFDIVALSGTLEHFKDPAAALVRIRKLLKPGGMLILINVPNMGGLTAGATNLSFQHFAWNAHVSHFRNETLQTLLHKSGFRIVHADGLAQGFFSTPEFYAWEPFSFIAKQLWVSGNDAVQDAKKKEAKIGGRLETLYGNGYQLPRGLEQIHDVPTFETWWNKGAALSPYLGTDISIFAVLDDDASKMIRAPLVKADVLKWLERSRLEAAFHTVTGAFQAFKNVDPETLPELAQAAIVHHMLPAVDRLDVLDDIRKNRENDRVPVAFLLENQPQVALEAIRRGANILIGPGMTKAFVDDIRRQYLDTVFFTEILHDQHAEQDLAQAVTAGVDGIFLKKYTEWDKAFSSGPLAIRNIRWNHPELLIFGAGGIRETNIAEVLGRPEALGAAIGINQTTLPALKGQLARYAANAVSLRNVGAFAALLAIPGQHRLALVAASAVFFGMHKLFHSRWIRHSLVPAARRSAISA